MNIDSMFAKGVDRIYHNLPLHYFRCLFALTAEKVIALAASSELQSFVDKDFKAYLAGRPLHFGAADIVDLVGGTSDVDVPVAAPLRPVLMSRLLSKPELDGIVMFHDGCSYHSGDHSGDHGGYHDLWAHMMGYM